MTYTSNTPQGNQTIASTQGPILNNFGFLPTCIGQEHNFNASTPTATYHKLASMPNIIGGEPPTLTAGTVGAYYIFNGVPKYYDGTNIQNIPVCLRGTVALQSSSGSFVNIVTFPAESCGIYWLWVTGSAGANTIYQTGTWITNTNTLNTSITTTGGLIVAIPSGLILTGRGSGAAIPTLQYLVQYTTP